MFLRNLGSGSGGNATVVAHEDRAIIVDAGLSRRRMLDGLEGLRLEAVLITHRHHDHLGPMAAKLGAPVWIERENWLAAKDRASGLDGAQFFGSRSFRIGPFHITPFPLPHPGSERWTSHGFRIECGRKRLAYATDLGHAPDEVVEALSGVHVLFLESNHDPEMERASGRDPGTIDWVLSDHGHLSNAQCAETLARIGRPHTVVLGHLSQDCNRPALAREAARKALPRSTRLVLATQDEAGEPVLC
ncbi:MAG: MBL fold metallo-hydrolase [Planctomycetes bacterium]|nr:MBL fold metallo-hydrolase [Planctomycetota bacterium]